MEPSPDPLPASLSDSPSQLLPVAGMTCATCVGRVDRYLRAVPGVQRVSVSLATESALVVGDASRETLVAAIERSGYAVPRRDEHPRSELPEIALLLGSAALAMSAGLLLPHHDLPLVLPLLPLGAALLGLRRILPATLRSLRDGRLGMDALVTTGVLAALGSALLPGGEMLASGEAAAAVLGFVLLGRFIERRVRMSAASGLRAALALLPRTATRLNPDGSEATIPLDLLRIGDLVRVAAGERLPADGSVERGEGALDESLLTGESLPVVRSLGAPVRGGSLLVDGFMTIRLTSSGAGSTAARLAEMTERAAATRPPHAALVDRASALVFPVVLTVALASLAGHLLAGAPLTEALRYAATVLVAACPCAIGLATPLATAVAIGRLAGSGIIVRDAAALEGAARVRTLILDKTGTLTTGAPTLVATRLANGTSREELLRLAASAERGTVHPLSAALRSAATGLDLGEPSSVTVTPGGGIAATVEARRVLVGSRSYLQQMGVADLDYLAAAESAFAAIGLTAVFVAIDQHYAGALGFEDALRTDAADALARLRADRITLAVASGDRMAVVQRIGARLGLSSDTLYAECSPERKAALVTERRTSGLVAFAGDGANDAPALAAADLSIAIGEGADLAAEQADVIVPGSRLTALAELLHVARRTRGQVTLNLVYAFGYNALLLPIAAGMIPGLTLTMPFAAAAMAGSSIGVALLSLRLRRG